ncbi:PREDICTED: BRISC and BRCA1-A complex member 1-like [Dinoponera quadriceps]|uniref:BRISC and BRCA1-A complex member 1-like n=1 Tax=Dinoponera quadriceps TaxID=609295 RepID=A0A6P3WWZ4_DINQU|nr:PREDICTED: BRISC and BRCA1-A complex member 1-like [Dinoponera quadriceps]
MSNKESEDEVQIISEKLQAATTLDPPAHNNAQQAACRGSRKSVNNGSSPCQPVVDDKKVSCVAAGGDFHVVTRNLPELNLPEKILIVIDTVREQQCTPFKLGTGATYSPLYMIKRAVESFVHAKSTIQMSHEFALMTVDARSIHWLCDYTSDIRTVLVHLDGVSEDVVDEEQRIYDLDQLFEAIYTRITIPTTREQSAPAAPTFTSRVILIYGRSNSIPKFHNGRKYLYDLTDNPYFFLDVLFVHEPPGEDNRCEEVYAEITTLDTTNLSYILEVGRNAANIHNNMAKLLAHPLQRPLQNDASYTLYSTQAAQEAHTNV